MEILGHVQTDMHIVILNQTNTDFLDSTFVLTGFKHWKKGNMHKFPTVNLELLYIYVTWMSTTGPTHTSPPTSTRWQCQNPPRLWCPLTVNCQLWCHMTTRSTTIKCWQYMVSMSWQHWPIIKAIYSWTSSLMRL